MVFVNDLALVQNIPAWMKHAGTYDNTMTIVDVVFPAFLFIVGMAIPLAIQKRENRGDHPVSIAWHVLTRTVGLVVLGVFMVNADEINPEATLIDSNLWKTSLFICAILIWNIYPKNNKWPQISKGLKIVGVVGMWILWYTFRKGENGDIGMTSSWWGILGLIGWAYLLSVVVFSLFRNSMAAIVGCLFLFVLLRLGLTSESWGETGGFMAWLKSHSGHFCRASMCLSGMILTMILQNNESVKDRIIHMLMIGSVLLAAGFFLAPFGISKDLTTPAWALYSAGICAFIFPLIYWLVDVKGWSSWSGFIRPAGINPLLTYILPYLFYAAVGLNWLPEVLNNGLPGLIRSIVFTLFILGIASIMTRWKIRLHL